MTWSRSIIIHIRQSTSLNRMVTFPLEYEIDVVILQVDIIEKQAT